MSSPVIDNNNYVIVNRQYFLKPNVYQYNDPYYDNGSRIMVSDLAPIAGLMLINDLIVNRGPDVNIFQTLLGTTIDLVTIQHVTTYSDVRYLGNQYFVYTPQFTRYRSHDNGLHLGWGPKNYKKYDEWKDVKSEQKQYRKEEKDIKKNIHGNDGNMYYDKENGKKNNGNDNGKKYNGNDNGKKNNDNGNDNGKKQNGNDNGKKHEGNDNGKKQNDDHGNKQNGNDNGNKHEDNGHGKGKK
jgi:hypothetical protein